MNNYREKVLEATRKANEFKNENLDNWEKEFDLWEIVNNLNIPIFFRPLDNLWGGAITIDNKQGILVKSDLPNHLQRFTLAHELGHVILGHDDRFDDENSVNMRVSDSSDRPMEEMTADAFASELLASREIITQHARRNGWGKKELQKPKYIYQLSVRLGMSFEATIWSLVGYDLISQKKGEQYNQDPDLPKNCKTVFAPNLVSRNSHADVWSLSEKESGVHLNADEKDIFVIELEERTSSGYQWKLSQGTYVQKISDNQFEGEKYGSFGTRKIGFLFSEPGEYTVQLRHMRPWNGEVIEELNFPIDTRGGQDVGLPRNRKESVLQMGVA